MAQGWLNLGRNLLLTECTNLDEVDKVIAKANLKTITRSLYYAETPSDAF